MNLNNRYLSPARGRLFVTICPQGLVFSALTAHFVCTTPLSKHHPPLKFSFPRRLFLVDVSETLHGRIRYVLCA